MGLNTTYGINYYIDSPFTDPDYYKHRMTTFAGFPYDFSEKNTFDDSPEEREAFYQKLWDNGMFWRYSLNGPDSI